jgi:hypothetical protein
MVYQAVTSLGTGLLVVPLVILALAGLLAGGHRCITIVQPVARATFATRRPHCG